MPSDIKQLGITLSEEKRQLFALQMETFAGFTDHTDHEVGRLVDAIEEIGEIDNTFLSILWEIMDRVEKVASKEPIMN